MTGKTVEVIAEIANAHQGDPAQAHRLAMLAFDAGADAVKFQVYTAEELLVVRHPRYEHFRRQAFPRTVWEELIPAARARGRVYCDVFGFDALDTALALGVEGLKVHTSVGRVRQPDVGRAERAQLDHPALPSDRGCGDNRPNRTVHPPLPLQ